MLGVVLGKLEGVDEVISVVVRVYVRREKTNRPESENGRRSQLAR